PCSTASPAPPAGSSSRGRGPGPEYVLSSRIKASYTDQMNDHEPLTELGFTVSGRIARPRAEVYEAVADPEQLSRYFTTGGARGRLEAGTEVSWDFHDFPGAFPVTVVEAIPPRRIVIRWAAAEAAGEDGMTTTTFEFAPLDDDTRTLVTIAESSWRPD